MLKTPLPPPPPTRPLVTIKRVPWIFPDHIVIAEGEQREINLSGTLMSLMNKTCTASPLGIVNVQDSLGFATHMRVWGIARGHATIKITDPLGMTLGTISVTVTPPHGTWTTPAEMLVARSSFGAAVFDGKIYVAGGAIAGPPEIGNVESYDPNTNQWTALPPLNVPRYSLALVVARDQLYAIGGAIGSGTPLGTVEVFNPRSAASGWTKLPHDMLPRFGLGAGTFGDRIYAFGGVDASTQTDTVQVLDTRTGTWNTSAPPLGVKRASFGFAAALGNLYAVGGDYTTGGTASVEVYAPSPGASSVGPALPRQRAQGPACAVMDEKLYVVGGKEYGQYQSAILVDDLRATPPSWNYVTDIPTHRDQAAVVALDGILYVLGGMLTGTSFASKAVEAYTV